MRVLFFYTVVVLLSLSFGSAVMAGSNIGLYSIGGKIGLVMPEDPIESTFGLGVHADLGQITKDIHLSALIDYWRKSYDSGTPLYGKAEWNWTEIIIGATAKYFFKTKSIIEPYAGGGLGLTIGRSKWETENYDDSASDTDFGLHFVGGLEYPLSPTMKGIAEAKYHVNGADYFGIFAGITFLLGK